MSRSEPQYLERYWSGVVRRLQAEVDVLNRLIPHNAERGRANELTLSTLLANLLPKSFGIGTGLIIDSRGSASSQIDIVVYDRSSQPAVMAQTTQLLFPVESVYLAIEVKTTLDADEITDAGAKRQSLRRLRSTNAVGPGFALLAYDASDSAGNVAKQIGKLEEELRPEALCVLSPGIIGGSNAQDGSYSVGLVPLHKQGVDGSRLENCWQRPTGDETAQYVVRDGTLYPTTSPVRYGREKLICEPGRALLLFCDLILEQLERAGAIVDNVMGKYITARAREVYELELMETGSAGG